MTTLPLLETRNAINIDTHERAIVYSALLLRRSNTATDNEINSAYKNAIRITTSESQSTEGIIASSIILEVKIPYNSQDALGSGNFIENITPLSDYSPADNFPVLASNNNDLGVDPDFVDSLEKYLAYHCVALQNLLISTGKLDIFKKIKIGFYEEDTLEPSIKISLILPYDFSVYLQTRNLLQAVSRLITVINYASSSIIAFSEFSEIYGSKGFGGISAINIAENSNYLLSESSYFNEDFIPLSELSNYLVNVDYISEDVISLSGNSGFTINLQSVSDILLFETSSLIKSINFDSLSLLNLSELSNYLVNDNYISVGDINLLESSFVSRNIINLSEDNISVGDNSSYSLSNIDINYNDNIVVSEASGYFKYVDYISQYIISLNELSSYIRNAALESLSIIQIVESSEYTFNSFDPYWDNVVLYLKGDGVNGSTNIIDSSNSAKTVSVFGDTNISTTQSKYGGSSIYFNGNGDYLKSPTSTDFTFGTSDWTIEAWVYNTTTNRHILGFRYNDTFVSQQFILSNFGSSFAYWWQNGNVVAISNYPLNQWNHIAVTRSSNVHKAFVNGVLTGSPLIRANNENVTNQVYIGTNAYSTLSYMAGGYLDSLRITKGVARYTSNFNPETDTYLAY